MGAIRVVSGAVALVVGSILLASCGESTPPPPPAPDLAIDPATLEVRLADGAPVDLIDHRRAEHGYAGAIDDEPFIAVSLDDDVATGDP